MFSIGIIVYTLCIPTRTHTHSLAAGQSVSGRCILFNNSLSNRLSLQAPKGMEADLLPNMVEVDWGLLVHIYSCRFHSQPRFTILI